MDFKTALKTEITKTIKRMKDSGTTSASLKCVKQCTKTPSRCLAGAPGSVYGYDRMFIEVAAPFNFIY